MRNLILLLILLSYNSFSQLKFSDKATELGIPFGYGAGTYGGGISFYDYNKDGWDDLTIATELGSPILFYKNVNGNFVQDNLNMPENNHETKQVLWLDYDNDGDLDFFSTSESGDTNLYQNDGDYNFTDVTSSSGIAYSGTSTWGASWGDYNNDSFLDLYINFLSTGDTNPNVLFKNNGDGTFTDVTSDANLNPNIDSAFCSAFFDYNNDGFQDLYVTNHKYDQSYLYKNNGDSTFSDVSVEASADVFADGMSTTIGDYNNDGFFDIYITNSAAGNVHLKNKGDGTFENIAEELGTIFHSVSWGATFLDADCDGNLDLYVSGQNDGTDGRLPSAFYKNNVINFQIPNNIGFENDIRRSFANAIGDIDNDGLPDIYVVNEIDNNFLWKNETTNSNNWLKIKLEGVDSNKDGIGNKIEIFSNGKSQYRYTLCGEGYLGQNSSYEFFGVADATIIDYVKVTWNKTGIVETITDVDINQAITIKEGEGILNVATNTLNNISVSPNPSTGVYSINSAKSLENLKVKVFDISGKEININLLENDSIDLSDHSSGIYLVKIISSNKSQTFKVIKE